MRSHSIARRSHGAGVRAPTARTGVRGVARPAAGAIVVAALLVVVALGWTPAPASAHNYLVGSTPAAGSVVTEQPGTFSVTTNDTLLDLGSRASGNAMRISGPNAGSDTAGGTPLYYGDGCSTLFGTKLETTAQLGAPGEYTVTWQVVSTDGHPVSGTFAFTWQPAAGQALAAGSPVAPACAADAAAAPAPAADAAASAPEAGALADALWIAGAAVAVLVAVAVTLLLTRTRTRTRTRRRGAGSGAGVGGAG